MAQYMTRIELHDAREEEYETLHSAMEVEGFERTITSSKGKTYHLPTAEYYREAELTRSEVLESAKRAAAKTGRDFAAVVTESKGITWYNLTLVQQYR